jgi:DNA-3-methyladenine glycosylase II
MPNTSRKLLHFQEQLRAAERHLSRRDQVLRPYIKRHGPCRLRPHTRYFETLVDAIVSQQLSTRAAETIFNRFKAIYAPARFPKPAQILATPDETIRAVGLSNGKVSFLKDLAAKTEDGDLKLARLSRMGDGEIVEMLTGVKGIGVWTVHMFLIFSLGRLDVLPVGDLGIRRGIERLYGLDHTPDAAEIEALAEEHGWRPYCSVASWYVWRGWGEK